MKTRAASIHIGLNRVSPSHWAGWSGELAACQNDAAAMDEICKSRKIADRRIFLDEQATRGRVIDALYEIKDNLAYNGLFVLTFSGHGGQLIDTDGDENDGLDETWCLFDGHLLDDELAECFLHFKPAQRILVVADCCHSGTTARSSLRVRGHPARAALNLARTRPNWFARLIPFARKWGHQDPKFAAQVIILSACLDHQYAFEEGDHGLFTAALMQSVDNARNYDNLFRHITSALPQHQTPVYWPNRNARRFAATKPFSI